MTLEEYEKVLEEKRKALQALKTESSRKVDVKEFETMQQLSNKKTNDDIFIKLVTPVSFHFHLQQNELVISLLKFILCLFFYILAFYFSFQVCTLFVLLHISIVVKDACMSLKDRFPVALCWVYAF